MKKLIGCILLLTLALVLSALAPYECVLGNSASATAHCIIVSPDESAMPDSSDASFILFDGAAFPPAWITWGWGQSTVSVEGGAGATKGTNAVKWVQGNQWGNGWSGFGVTMDSAFDMSAIWESDSLKFRMKAAPGTGLIRVQLEDKPTDPRDRVGVVFDPLADGAWHDFAFALNELGYQDGSTVFDSAGIWIFGFMGEASAIAGKVVYIDRMWAGTWTGQADVDSIPPAPPPNLFVAPGDYSNLIVWEDVQGEDGEMYDLYCSTSPISSLEDENLEVVARNVPENTQLATHLLTAPVTDQETSYYYALVCKDASYNISAITATASATTNTAKGIVTISLHPPVALACDGDLSEWAGIDPIRIYTSRGALYVANYPVDNDEDLSVDAYLAVDAEYLYMACDVTDDMVQYDPGVNPWENDRIDVFIGLYDQRGFKHTDHERGGEPDYHFNFQFDQLLFEVPAMDSFYTPDSVWYYVGEKFPSGYIIETRLPWARLAGTEDTLFFPKEGMRIPIDFSIQDRDEGVRQGILTWSPDNQDRSYQSPGYWTHTWIGALWEPVEGCGTIGDVNNDAAINVLDVLAVVNDILGTVPLTTDGRCRADCNGDASINVLDALGIVNVILGISPSCPGGHAKVEIYPETLEFLKTLRPYLSPENFTTFMAMARSVGVPTRYELSQNYPNPFNPSTTISYSLPVQSEEFRVKSGGGTLNSTPLTPHVTLKVFNVLGQEVATLVDGIKEPGFYTVTWDARDMASGIYFYRLEAGSYAATRSCLVVR